MSFLNLENKRFLVMGVANRKIEAWAITKSLEEAGGCMRTTTVDLQSPIKSPMLRLMNAGEIIEEIARLPENEKGKVVEFVRHLPNAETLEAINESAEDLPRYTSMDEVSSALKDLVNNA